MARIVLIYNPASGRADARAREAAAAHFARRGWSVESVPTEHGTHAAELARGAARDGVDAVVVSGGDGTVAQAVEGLLGGDVPLGILPSGTGNQLARNLGIPSRPRAAARTVTAGRMRRIDVGAWRAGKARSPFVVACGAGFDAQVMAATTAERKRRGRMWAYLGQAVSLARRVRPSAFRITVDGRVSEMEAATVLVANCPRVAPPYTPLRRGVALDDGVLDVVWLRAAGLAESLWVWARLAHGGQDPKRIGHLRGGAIEVESVPSVPAQCDGDVTGATPFTASVRPGALSVFA